MTVTEPVTMEGDGHVLLIRLNRPGHLNAVNRELSRGLGDAIEVAGDRPR